MSKAALAVAGTGVGSASMIAGGVYLSGAFTVLNSDLPEDVNKLKTEEAKGCVAYLFPKLSLDSSKKGDAITDSSKVDAKYFGSSEDGSACLTINWERDDFSDAANSWRGNFRWLWSFTKGDKGLVMFTSASPSETEKELALTGIVYLIKRVEKDGWVIDKYKDINSGKKINQTDFDNVFPKVGDVIKSTLGQKNQEYWDFVNGKEGMEKACKKDDNTTCKTKSKSFSFKGLWLMNSFDGETEMKKWSSNIDNLLDTLYTTSDLSIKDAVKSLNGEWKLNSLVHKEIQSADTKKT